MFCGSNLIAVVHTLVYKPLQEKKGYGDIRPVCVFRVTCECVKGKREWSILAVFPFLFDPSGVAAAPL